MVSEKQLQANRQNALQSTGPKTPEGVEAVKLNALRHGLRSVQTVVPGEDLNAWEAHRAAVVEDLKPVGALELALAETAAAKLWRLGRVVRYEADVITIGQDKQELAFAHEAAHNKKNDYLRRKMGVTVSQDVRDTAGALRTAQRSLKKRDDAIRILDALPTMGRETTLPWEFAETLMQALNVDEQTANKFEKECETNAPGFLSGHVLDLLARRGEPEEVAKSLGEFWREDRKCLEDAVRKATATHKRTLRRYNAALERRRGCRLLPDGETLEKIQRYEAHLERGLHRALERLQTLQEARMGFASRRNPAVALAVIQATQAQSQMASIGNSQCESGGGWEAEVLATGNRTEVPRAAPR
jgi:hypothetical protein